MKMNSNAEINDYLRNDCDLGYMLDYLNTREIRTPYWLPIIDVLRQMPEFEKVVTNIRRKLNIETQEYSVKFPNKIDNDQVEYYLQEVKQVARGLQLPTLSKHSHKKIDLLLDKRISVYQPRLSKYVASIRLSLFGKLQHTWHAAIERYIVFGIIESTPLLFRKPLPVITHGVDPHTNEPYISIQVYSDTDLSFFARRSWLNELQSIIPNYQKTDRWTETTILKRFLHYVLRKKAKLPHAQINDWLVTNGFNTTDIEYRSQEVTRFENLLKTSFTE